MAGVEYKNIDCGMRTRSLKGQIPFVELNGREIADSNVIINLLSTIFRTQLDSHLYEAELASARAFASMVENNLFWVMLNMRTSHVNELFSDRGMGGTMSKTMKPFSSLIAWHVGRGMQKKLDAQGTGVHTLSENIEAGKKDLRSLSIFLDKKKYLTGIKPCSADATIFAHLVQFWYLPVHSTPIKQYIATECPNLVDYIERMKAEYWPDWEEATSTLSLHTKKN